MSEIIYIEDEKFNITFDIESENDFIYKDFIMDNIKNIVSLHKLKRITFSGIDNHYNDWNVGYRSTYKRKDESTNKYLLTNFYSINYYDAANNKDVYVGGFRVTRELSKKEYYHMEFTFTPLENLYLNMASGLLPENLSEEEVNMLKEKLGDNWFEELGYYEPEYKRSKYDTSKTVRKDI